jgi:hypothetical protein
MNFFALIKLLHIIKCCYGQEKSSDSHSSGNKARNSVTDVVVR